MLRWHTWDAQVLTSTFETHRCLPQAWLSSKYDLHVLTQSLQQLKRPAQGHRVCQWQSQESTNHRPCDIRAHSVIPGHQLPKLVNDGAGSRPGQPDSRAHAISITNGSGWAERLRPGHQPEQDGLWLAPCPDSAQTSQEGKGQGKPSQSWPSGTPRGRDQVVANQVLGLLSQ